MARRLPRRLQGRRAAMVGVANAALFGQVRGPPTFAIGDAVRQQVYAGVSDEERCALGFALEHQARCCARRSPTGARREAACPFDAGRSSSRPQ
eukprot:6795507-Lingulodinium_polyedra.AAC.1